MDWREKTGWREGQAGERVKTVEIEWRERQAGEKDRLERE
jgi:hypothetical protein